MKLITRLELASRSTSELRGLLSQTFDALAASASETAERRTTTIVSCTRRPAHPPMERKRGGDRAGPDH